MSKKNQIVEGVIWKQVLLFFIPLTIGAFFQHFYTIVDTVIIGKFLGVLSLSAVGGSASKVIVLLINFFVGVSVGITSYVSRYYGKKDNDMVKSTILNGLTLFAVLSVILSCIGIVFSKQILTMMNTPLDTIQNANIYLRTYLAGLIFCISYNTISGILRGLGDSKKPLYVLIVCSIVNIVLDIIFIVLFDMGVFGAALATVLSQLLSTIILGYILVKSIGIIDFKKIKLDLAVMKEISAIGIPSGIQSIMFSLSNIVVQSGVNTFGAISVASWSAYVRIDSIVDIFLSSLGSTAITFVGQNLGAKNIKRVRESVKQIMLITYAIVGGIVIIFILNRTFLISMFTEDKQVIEIGSKLMFIILPMYILSIPQQILSQSLRGIGKSFVPMLLTLVGVIGVRLIWVLWFLPLNPSLNFLALCYPFSAIIMSVIFTVYYKYEIRKLRMVN